jgi:hypothetical protein
MYSSKKVLMELYFKIGHVIMELVGKEENQAKDDPERESGNRRILSASFLKASLHWTKDRLICSIIVTLSCPENLVKSGTLYRCGIAI